MDIHIDGDTLFGIVYVVWALFGVLFYISHRFFFGSEYDAPPKIGIYFFLYLFIWPIMLVLVSIVLLGRCIEWLDKEIP